MFCPYLFQIQNPDQKIAAEKKANDTDDVSWTLKLSLNVLLYNKRWFNVGFDGPNTVGVWSQRLFHHLTFGPQMVIQIRLNIPMNKLGLVT